MIIVTISIHFLQSADDPDDPQDTDPLLGGVRRRANHGANIQTRRSTPGIPPTHSKVYEDDSGVESGAADLARPPNIDTRRPDAIGFFTALLLPGVIPYSLAYAALKLVNYSFFFWLPFYLHDAYGWSADDSNNISQW